MLRLLSDLQKCTLAAKDGEIGEVTDLYFDDQTWRSRHVVVNTGSWLLGRRVLIPPRKLGRVDWPARKIEVDLTLDQVRNSPPMDADRPLSRQRESDWLRYYGSSAYWLPEAAAVGSLVGPLEEVATMGQGEGDPHLRSTGEISGYTIHALDGDVGRAQDFLLDDDSWHVRYLVILRSWWAGTRVILSPRWIHEASWAEMKVFIDLSRETIKEAPVWDGHGAPSREFEEQLHHFYQRRAYWDDERLAVTG